MSLHSTLANASLLARHDVRHRAPEPCRPPLMEMDTPSGGLRAITEEEHEVTEALEFLTLQQHAEAGPWRKDLRAQPRSRRSRNITILPPAESGPWAGTTIGAGAAACRL